MEGSKERIADLVRAFGAHGWKGAPWREAFAIAASDPLSNSELVRAFLVLGESVTFIHDVLALMPEVDWANLVRDAVAALALDADNEQAENILNAAAFQCPEALSPHLWTLFGIDKLYQGAGVLSFRRADAATIELLKAAMVAKNTAANPRARFRPEYVDTRMRAFSALLQTGSHEAIEAAVSFALRRRMSKRELRAWLLEVHLERSENSLRALCGEAPLHVAFPPGYLASPPSHFMRGLHPTWPAPGSQDVVHRFGGRADVDCRLCGDHAHRLIALDPLPSGFGVHGLSRLDVVTCLTCLGYRSPVMWTDHDAEGRALGVSGNASGEADVPVHTPLAEARVALVDIGRRWARQDWGHSNSRENLHRLGGRPTFVQSACYPACPVCKRTCRFLLQLDSELPTENGHEWLWGTGGIGYVFWCDECRRSVHTWQCT